MPGFSAVTPRALSNSASVIPPSLIRRQSTSCTLNYTRFAFLKNKPVGGLGKITDFGYVAGGLGVIPTNAAYEGVAPISLDNTGANFGLPDGTTGQYNNTYQITDNFSN